MADEQLRDKCIFLCLGFSTYKAVDMQMKCVLDFLANAVQ